jgi:hypothetical protein
MEVAHPWEPHKAYGSYVMYKHLPEILALYIKELWHCQWPIKCQGDHVVPPAVWSDALGQIQKEWLVEMQEKLRCNITFSTLYTIFFCLPLSLWNHQHVKNITIKPHGNKCPLDIIKISTRQPFALLTPWSRVLAKVTAAQIVKKFPTFYGTWRFITMLTRACHQSLSWASQIWSTHTPILILSSHLSLVPLNSFRITGKG